MRITILLIAAIILGGCNTPKDIIGGKRTYKVNKRGIK